jgi:hypothetical protein
MSNTVVVNIEMDADALWSAVFGSAYEQMGWWLGEHFVEGDWSTAGLAKITFEDPDTSSEQTTYVNVDDLARGYSLALKNNYHHCGTGIDLEDPDACVGDIILQCAIFGEVIYG